MNILLVAQNYHPFVGGVETHVRQVAHELAKEHRVHVAAGNFVPCSLSPSLAMLHTNLLTPAYANYQDGEVPVHALTPTRLDRFRMLPIAVRATPRLRSYAYHGLNRFGYRWYRSVYLPRLRALMEREEIDVVHSLAGGYLGWTAQAAARERGLPFVCTPFVHPHQWGDGPEDVAYYLRSQAVIGLVETDRDYLHSLGVPAEKLHVIGVSPELPPTCDPDGFRRKHDLAGTPVVLYVGRMMPQKGAVAVLQATARVWEQVPETRFVFIGPASPSEAAAFEGCDPRIRYLGKVSLQEKADALAACDVFCMPSMSEILPTVYLEAWSYSKPVVGGMAHGLPELVEGNGAGLAASQEPEAVSRALLRLLCDPELRACMGARGKAKVEHDYSIPAVAGALAALYRKWLSNNERNNMSS